MLYCSTIFFLNCLYDYNLSLTPESSPGQIQTIFVLVEAFLDLSLPGPTITEPKSKRRKGDPDINVPYVTVEKPELKNVMNNFVMAVNCWDLLNGSDTLHRGMRSVLSVPVLELNGFGVI